MADNDYTLGKIPFIPMADYDQSLGKFPFIPMADNDQSLGKIPFIPMSNDATLGQAWGVGCPLFHGNVHAPPWTGVKYTDTYGNKLACRCRGDGAWSCEIEAQGLVNQPQQGCGFIPGRSSIGLHSKVTWRQ